MRLIDADSLKIELIASTELGWEVWGVEEEDIKNAPTIYPIQNDPLTIDQLLEMDGEPVWTYGNWVLVKVTENMPIAVYCDGAECSFKDILSVGFPVYRRRPGEDAHGWISVNDRMPDENTPVLVTWIGINGEVHSDAVAAIIYGQWYWWEISVEDSLEFDAKCTFVQITHWMPIPEMPEAVKRDGK